MYHIEEYKIRSSEVAPGGKARLQALCDLLQEAAGNHALRLNFDISQLQEQGLTWVLHRLHVQMDRYPSWRDTIKIKTWPSSGDSLRAFRDFIIMDNEDNVMGRALSYWLMMNVNTRRPVRMPQEILDMAPNDVDHVLDIKKERLSPLPEESVSTARDFSVRNSDLDLNRHVNNVKYIEWTLETLCEDVHPAELDIEFHGECSGGQTIRSEAELYDLSSRHQIIRKEDDRLVALALCTLPSR